MIVYVYNTLFSKKQIIPATGHSTDDRSTASEGLHDRQRCGYDGRLRVGDSMPVVVHEMTWRDKLRYKNEKWRILHVSVAASLLASRILRP